MIWPQDALLLAATKLKTRRIRLFIAVFIAGILFVILCAASLVANGTFKSIESFSSEGLGKRFILQTSPARSFTAYYGTPSVDPAKLAQVKAAYESLKKEKAAAAKKLGITYDPASEVSPITTDPVTNTEFYDEFSPLVQKLFKDQNVDQQATEEIERALEKVKNEYNGVGVYKMIPLGAFSGPTVSQNAPTLTVLKDGKEEVPTNSQMNYGPPSSGLEGIETGLAAFSDGMLKDFLLPGQDLEIIDDAVPIVIPYQASEEILGLTPLQSGTDAKTRLSRIKEVRESIAGKTFDVCLRNTTSVERQSLAVQQQTDHTANKDKKGYKRPDLMYDVSEQPCLDVIVSRDVRTAETKKYDTNYDVFLKQFGKADATQRIVRFRVVGVSPNQPEYAGFTVSDIISSMLSSYLGLGWYIPTSAASLLPEYSSELSKPLNQVEKFSGSTVYIEVSDAESARKLVKEMSCELGSSAFSTPESQTEAVESCIAAGQSLMVSPYGSNSLALDQARNGFRRTFPKVLLVVAGISALIMMGTVGKIIADSRRETAVFRAIGAKRLDIAQIYLTYTALIAVLITAVALLAGYGVARFIDARFSDTITVEAIVSFNAQDLSRTFGLIGVSVPELLMLVGVIFAGSLVSAFLPLLTNLRRSPIRDMRDER